VTIEAGTGAAGSTMQLQASPAPASAARAGAAPSADELDTLYIGLVRAYHAALVGFIHSMVPAPQQAEDLAQDTFVKAYVALPRVGMPDNPRAWLFRIATNVTIDHLRRQRRLAWTGLDRLAHVLRGADDAERADRADPIRRALAALSPGEQATLMLFAHAGLKAPEVGEALGISPPAARKRRQRARAAFMRAYRKEVAE